MISAFLEFLMNGVMSFMNGFFGLFPTMPDNIQQLRQMLGLDMVETVFGWVNYFLPLDIASSIVALWSAAIMAYVALKLGIKYTKAVV